MTEKKLYERLSNLRKDITEMDWTPDGRDTNAGYPFLSESKMKGQINPALVKNGLEWSVEYDNLRVLDPVGAKKNHYIVRATAKIRAIGDNTEKAVFIAYGEGSSSNDKAVSFAQTNAFKNLIANNFMLSSYTAEAESSIESASSAKAEKTLPPTVSKQERAEAKEILQQTAPVTKPSEVKGPKLNAIQVNAIEKIMASARTSDAIILESFGGLDVIELEYHETLDNNDSKKAAEFIKKYKELVRT